MSALIFTASSVKPTTSDEDIMSSAAVAATALGFRVFLVHGISPQPSGTFVCDCGRTECPEAGKHPVFKGWPASARADMLAARLAWQSHPNSNIGIATGTGLTVLDFDRRKGGDRSLRQLERQHGTLPPTWVIATADGWHFYYLIAPGAPPIYGSVGRIASGVDVRGEGNYVVGLGSRHKTGHIYAWVSGYEPSTIPLAVMPDWLASLCRETRPTRANARSSDELAQLVNGKVGEGMRNDMLTRIVGHILWTGKVSPHVALKFARLWNESQCVPPLDDQEVVRIVDSICGRELLKRRAR